MATAIDSKALSKAMDLVGITAAQLARSIDVSVEYVTMIRSGKRNLSRNPILRRRIATALDVPQRWIEIEA